MLCSSIIFLNNSKTVCEIDSEQYEHLNEQELLTFVKVTAKDKLANIAILRAVYHNHHLGVDTVLWSSN